MPSARAENDEADDHGPEKQRSRATSMIRRTAPAGEPDPPNPPEVDPGDPPPAEGEAPPSSGRVVSSPDRSEVEPAAADAPSPSSSAPDPAVSGDPPAPSSRPSDPSHLIPPPTPSAEQRRLLADPTQRPPEASSRPSSVPSAIVTPKKPLLASEALMEDLAPMQPARRDARIWCVACGVGFLVFGTLPLLGLLTGGLGAALPWLVTGAISLIAGISRVGYRQRAVAMLVLGALTGLVALQGSPTLVRADGGPAWGMARLFSSVALTGALLFRARYRAYAGARVFLGTALAISIPFVIHAARVLGSEAGFGPAHVGSVLVLLAIAATLIGFMGAETTGAGPYLPPVLVLAFAVELACRGIAVVGISQGIAPLVGIFVGAAGFGAAAGFTALGLFQILAWRFAADARRIDLHSRLREPPPPSDHDPSREWTSRD